MFRGVSSSACDPSASLRACFFCLGLKGIEGFVTIKRALGDRRGESAALTNLG